MTEQVLSEGVPPISDALWLLLGNLLLLGLF